MTLPSTQGKSDVSFDCDRVTQSYVLPLEAALREEVWPSVSFNSLRFHFPTADGRIYLYGYSKSELVTSRLPVESCPDAKVKYVTLKPNPATMAIPYSASIPPTWATSLPAKIAAMLKPPEFLSTFLKPYLVYPLPNPIVVPGDDETATFLFITIHEGFHALQYKYFKNMHFIYTLNKDPVKSVDSLYSYRDCAKADFEKFLLEETKDWDWFRFEKKEVFTAPELNSFAEKILKRRLLLRNSSTLAAKCLLRLGLAERIEGSADYNAMRRFEKTSRSTYKNDWRLNPQSPDPKIIQGSILNTPVAYYSGNSILRLLDLKLSSSQWQPWINQGDTPLQALQKAFNQKKNP